MGGKKEVEGMAVSIVEFPKMNSSIMAKLEMAIKFHLKWIIDFIWNGKVHLKWEFVGGKNTLGDFRNSSTISIFLLPVAPYNFYNFDTKMV